MADNNTNIPAVLEDKVLIQLDGKPTTGHVWTSFYLEGNAILQDGEPYFQRNRTNPGAPGWFYFPYVAFQIGDAKVKLVEGRSWESNPINVFMCSFTVTKGN